MSNEKLQQYKNTLSLPNTNFSMRANLTTLEKQISAFWGENNIYQTLFERKSTVGTAYLCNGPMYSNGEPHAGHALNFILKDLVLRFYAILGYKIQHYTGHDCHGLPIELNVLKASNKITNTQELIEKCHQFSDGWIKKHQQAFRDVGMLIDPNKYYATKDQKKIIYQVFSDLLLKNHVYIKSKPVQWSIKTQTVVPDIEIEYREKESTSLYVKFPIVSGPLTGVNILIWTTTPWTLIDNAGVACSDSLVYVICTNGDERYIIAQDVFEKMKDIVDLTIKETIVGKTLTQFKCKHPFRNIDVPIILSTHVSGTEGTGFVHIAPSHGLEDYELGLKYNLEQYESTTIDGFYHIPGSKLSNLHIFDNENEIISLLSPKILSQVKIKHQYPYETRSGIPLIYRLSKQVFLKLPTHEEIIEGFKYFDVIPANGKESFLKLMLNRKEWCISRNRNWGVPLALFTHKETGELLINKELQVKIINEIQDNTDIFLRNECKSILNGIVNSDDYELYVGVIEVWFDSACVPEMTYEYTKNDCDIIVEGHDQYRGWFGVLLLLSLLQEKKPPFKKILTHGFVNDGYGYKMSKSKGNVLNLYDMLSKYGADILRIWVLSSDFTEDVRVSYDILDKSCSLYRKIRNVMRYLISIVESIKSEENDVSYQYLEKIIIGKLHFALNEYKEATLKYEFNKAFLILFDFIQELSGFYFNARKDVLYCDSESSEEKQSTKKAMLYILKQLNIALAPIVPFTSEELFQYMKNLKTNYSDNTSVMFEILEVSNEYIEFAKIYDQDMKLFEKINLDIDTLKRNGEIQKNTDIILHLNTSNLPHYVINEIFGFSNVINSHEYKIEVHSHSKCQRCWKMVDNYNELCNRCHDVVAKL